MCLQVSKISKICLWLPNCVSNLLKNKFCKLFYIFFHKMVSILISITQHEQYFFLFQAQFATVCLFLLHATSCSSLMSHYRANNQCDRVKGWHWRWLIYTPHIFYYVITCYLFSEATTSVLESFTNSTGFSFSCIGVSFLKSCRPAGSGFFK